MPDDRILSPWTPRLKGRLGLSASPSRNRKPACHLYNRKDDSGQFVRVRHELSTPPGVIEQEQVLDPAKETAIKIEGGQLVAFPSIPEDAMLILRGAPSRAPPSCF